MFKPLKSVIFAAAMFAGSMASAVTVDFSSLTTGPGVPSFTTTTSLGDVIATATVISGGGEVPSLVKPEGPNSRFGNSERGLGVLGPGDPAGGAIVQGEAIIFDLSGNLLESFTLARRPDIGTSPDEITGDQEVIVFGDPGQQQTFTITAANNAPGDTQSFTIASPETFGSVIRFQALSNTSRPGFWVNGLELVEPAAVIPVPATAPLLAGALLAGAFVLRRKRKAA